MTLTRGRQQARHVIADSATLVTFTIGHDVLAAPVELVERVLRFVAPSPTVNASQWVAGTIQHRCRMVPVIDLRKRLQRQALLADANTRIIVFSTQPEWTAAIVDSVSEVLVVEASTIVAAPERVRGLSGDYLLGRVPHNDDDVLVLDIARLLTSGEQLSLSEPPLPVT